MQDLYIEATDKTPLVKCLYSSGTVAISGRSLPEDAARFWFPVIQWISDYYRNPQEDTFVILNLEYLNSASSSMLHKLFFALDDSNDSKNQTCIVNGVWMKTMTNMNWHRISEIFSRVFRSTLCSMSVSRRSPHPPRWRQCPWHRHRKRHSRHQC